MEVRIITNYERYSLIRNGISGDVIKELIYEHMLEAESYIKKYERYAATVNGVPIFNRTMKYDRVNNKVNNDFFSEVIDNKVGYMLGNPISYVSDDEVMKKRLERFVLVNNLEDMDTETLKMASICGVAFRLCYINPSGIESVMDLKPWEVIYIEDDRNQPYAAVRYYNLTEDIIKIEVYDKINRYQYELRGGEIIAILPVQNGNVAIPHLFDDLPIIKFKNNAEELGDCDKVLALIDAYDKVYSDVNSEIEQFRLAYLALFGADFDKEDIDAIKKTGAVSMPEGSDAKFITKNLDDAIIEHHLDRAEKNIQRFAKNVDFNSTEFGTASGIALRYKLLGLENKSKTSERKFSTGLRQMFKVIASAWSKKEAADYLSIWWTYKRNIPIDILTEADATNKLKGYVSEKTRLALLSFVTDVNFEIKEMQKDMENFVDVSPGTDPQDDPDNGDVSNKAV
jgi:SPP1 family phage portal protein